MHLFWLVITHFPEQPYIELNLNKLSRVNRLGPAN
jgi:hypothetical protein